MGTLYLLDHQWFSPALPQTSLQTLLGFQPVETLWGEGEQRGTMGTVQAAPRICPICFSHTALHKPSPGKGKGQRASWTPKP